MYLECSEKWRLHYKERIRSTYLTSSLFFGGALDQAFSRLLLDKKKILTEAEQKIIQRSAEEIFIYSLENVELNGKKVSTENYDKVNYFKIDFDETLFELDEIDPSLPELIGKKGLKGEELKLHNDYMLESLRRKGLLMIEAYRKEVIPLLEEVISLQEPVRLPNDTNDCIIGFIDFRAIFKDEPGVIYTIDNKTASANYKQQQLDESPQLGIYSEFTGDKKVAYVVINKKLLKKAPRVKVQILRGEVKEQVKTQVFEEAEFVLEGIKNEQFKCAECKFSFGQMCVYNKLRKFGSMEGLVKL